MASLKSGKIDSNSRLKILSTARRHFFLHGLRTVTMDDLAGELGMSKKTLYAHFPSKDILLREVLHSKMDDVESDLSRLAENFRGDTKAEISAMLYCIQGHTDEIQPSFLRDIQRDAPAMFGIVEARRRALIQKFFGKLISEGRREGIIRSDIDPNLLIEILLSAVQALMNPKKIGELEFSPRFVFETIMSVIFDGALSKEARS